MTQTDFEEKQIGQHHYRVGKLDPLVAQDLWIDILKTVGPAIGRAGTEAAKAKDVESLLDGPEGIIAMLSSVESLTGMLSRAQMRELCEVFSRITFYSKDGSAWPKLDQSFNVHFRGRLDEMYGWLWFALKVNYGPLFKGIGSATDLVARFSSHRSQDQTQSTSTDTP